MLQHLADTDFEKETLTLGGRTLHFRSIRNIAYCESPKDPIQRMNLFAPEAHFEGGTVSGYTKDNAPIFCPSTVGGGAPAPIVDLKAAIRYLRTYAQDIPGNLDRIVTTGTSAGGALSALAGASGDAADYADELERIGAAMDASDAIFAASCYCPIHNLEHADMA